MLDREMNGGVWRIRFGQLLVNRETCGNFKLRVSERCINSVVSSELLFKIDVISATANFVSEGTLRSGNVE